MAFRRMLVSARRIGVPRKAERSDVLWGERLADLLKTVTCFYGHYLCDAPIYRLSSAFVAQRKAKVNGKNMLRKIFKALEFILNFSFMRLGKRTRLA